MKIILVLTIVLVSATAVQNVNDNLDSNLSKIKERLKFNNENITSSANNIQTRVIGGKLAIHKQFPYQVGLNVTIDDSKMWCGGSLISRRFVLTAAHCLYGGTSAVVILGAINILVIEKGQVRIRVYKEDFIIHSSYDTKFLHNDIALIRLPKPTPLSDYIQLIALPKANIKTEGRVAIASGWGHLHDGGKVTPRLRYVTLRTIPLQQCRTYFVQGITNGNVCTDSSNGKSICKGDSGGPLVVEENGVKTLIGLTSFVSNYSCEIGWPSAFTRVSSYLNWIQDHSDVKL